MLNIFHLLLAILGLGFLIFIHELGHYIMARRVGMTVEVFSIGFGPPLRTWKFQGVKWQFCMLPFGGYVKIAGMDKKGNLEPHQIADGFYGKKPIDRIKVALAGPVVNIAFAFIAFCGIWMSGGQEKPFQEYTNVIGFVDPQSKLYDSGIRPGDEFTAVDGKRVEGFRDIFVSMMLEEKSPTVKGNEIDYFSGQKEPFSVSLPHPSPTQFQLGAFPAQYLIFADFSSPASPLKESGIQKGDRIVWVDGELIFSAQQLSSVLNEPKALMTFQRDGELFLARVPRLKISDLCTSPEQKNELDDWAHAAKLKVKSDQLNFIPYLLNHEGVVQETVSFMNCTAEKVQPSPEVRHPLDIVLQTGDKIIAVDGTATPTSIDLLKQLQQRKATVIVERSSASSTPSWKSADQLFEGSFKSEALRRLITGIGAGSPKNSDHFILLPSISLISLADMPDDAQVELGMKKKQIEKIENSQERQEQLALLEQSQKRLMLGAFLTDRKVSYNPAPTTLFFNVFDQTWKTLSNLLTGYLSPKAMAGPVGIVQALQSSWASGIKDALYWLGFVSLNLAILNLLPIPVLDGGHIVFAAVEGVRKKPIKSKTMEKFILPFVVLLVILFIYLTYQDIIRLLHRFL